jgi:hypothetical protein
MVAQAGRELSVGRLVDHLRQYFHDLILGVVDVLQGVQEQILS